MGPVEQADNKLGEKKNQKSGLSIPKPVFFAVPQRLPEIIEVSVGLMRSSIISVPNAGVLSSQAGSQVSI